LRSIARPAAANASSTVQQAAREDRVDEHPAGRAEHARTLAERAAEIVDLLEDIATPDEVEVTVRVRELVHRAHRDGDHFGELRLLDLCARPLDVELDRIDPHPGPSVGADEPDQMRGVAAAGVQDSRPRCQVRAGQLVQRVRAARAKAHVE
jgi:hypothetical protein